MSSYSLSRSSRIYTFVFGHEKGKIGGFSEPLNDRISLGLFLGLLLATFILKPLAFCVFFLLDRGLKVMTFLVDGSYMQGNLLIGARMIKIEPWPRIRGYRLSPWIPLAGVIVAYNYYSSGSKDGLDSLICVAVVTLAFFWNRGNDRSPSVELAETLEPMVTKKLHLAYYREPRIFPALNLID